MDVRGKGGCYFLLSLSVSHDPKGQAIWENSQSGREEPVEHGIHGMWHDMWHVLVILIIPSALWLPCDSGSRSVLFQVLMGTRTTVHVLGLPLGKGLGLCLVGPASCPYPQFCFPPRMSFPGCLPEACGGCGSTGKPGPGPGKLTFFA